MSGKESTESVLFDKPINNMILEGFLRFFEISEKIQHRKLTFYH